MSSFSASPIRLHRLVLPDAVPPVTPMKIGFTRPELTSCVSILGSSAIFVIAGSAKLAARCYIVFFSRLLINLILQIIKNKESENDYSR